MLHITSRLTTLFSVSASALLMAACGGGGDTAQTAPPVALLAAYTGTWSAGCQVERSGSGVAVGSSKDLVILSAPDANGVSTGVSVAQYFNNVADCTGTAFATVTSPAATLTPAGAKIVAGGEVVKINIANPGGRSTFSGSASLASCNGLPNTPLDAVRVTLGSGVNTLVIVECAEIASNSKDIFSAVSSTNTFRFGDDATADAQGYPTALYSGVLLTKQ